MTEYCQKCCVRTTPEEPLCQCVDVLHAEIDRLRAELNDIKAERDAAFTMSRCECASDECCANLVRKDERIRELEDRVRDFERQVHYLSVKIHGGLSV